MRYNFSSYLINVKSRPDRLENAESRLSAFGIDFTYVEAITGDELVSLMRESNISSESNSMCCNLDT